MLTLVILLAALAPAGFTWSGVLAQAGLDGSACWPQGALTGVSGGTMTWSQAPATIIDPTQSYQASLDTTAGNILIQLDAANAPIATNNFICLALAGYYTGTDFHRIFAGFLIQGGDPSATGTGNPGYTIPSDPTLGPYPIGSVSMANSGPDQNGSQFFIAAADLTGAFDPIYPVFGQVSGGMEVVQAISEGAVQAQVDGEQSKPVDPAVVLNVTIETAGGSAGPAGPALNQPTQTPVPAPEQPTQTPQPTAEPTQASASTDAQGRPGGSTASTAPTTTTNTGVVPGAGCTGFPEYQEAFDQAYTTVAIANPDALAFLLEVQNAPETTNIFEEMTPEQASAMSAFYLGLSDELSAITPPAFAAEWHAIQIEIFRELGEFTGNVASQGLMFASMQASAAMSDLSDRSDAAVIAANDVCGEFAAWATGEEPE
jgi:cyclophilin family peptidyl-prolyl cis-trans isomerase